MKVPYNNEKKKKNTLILPAFSNQDTSFKFALEADMFADRAFCSEECEWILTTLWQKYS